jgi:hypothetical protein
LKKNFIGGATRKWFNTQTEFRSVQNDAVIEYSDLLNAAMLVNTENKFEVLYFEQTYF